MEYEEFMGIFAGTANKKQTIHMNNLSRAELMEEIEKYTIQISANPSDANAYTQRSLAKLVLKEHDSALKDIDIAIKLSPSAEKHNLRGIINALNEKPDEAIEDFINATKLDDKDIIAYQNIVEIKMVLQELDCVQKYKETSPYLDKILSIDPDNTRALCRRGELNSEYPGDEQKALQDFNKVLELEPKNSMVWLQKGKINFYFVKDYEEARKCYDIAIESDPKNAAAYFERGVLKYNLKQYKEAEGSLKECMKIKPCGPQAELASMVLSNARSAMKK